MIRVQTYTAGIGSTVFVKRLMKYLQSHYPVCPVDRYPDIYLSCVWGGNPPKKCIHLHRVDGVYFDTLRADRKKLNRRVKKAIEAAHGVIFQSIYSRKICRGILKVKKKEHTIIYNGFDRKIYDNLEIDKFGYNRMLLACAKWRPLKRPMSIAKGFLEAGLGDTILIIIGEIAKKHKIKHKQIKYIGSLKSHQMYPYYKSCDGVIHISRLDACPNVVVEALVAGKPVLCNNAGGTPEIVKDSGVVLEMDPPFNYRPFPLRKPDSVSPQLIAEGIHKLLNQKWNINRDDLNLAKCAELYYLYFKRFVGR